jgi:hypothetical protein
MRPISIPTLGIALAAAALLAACGKAPTDPADPQASARAFSAEKIAAAKDLEERRKLRAETAEANAEDIRKESERTFRTNESDRPALNTAENQQIVDDAVARLRTQVPDPETVQVRKARVNESRDTVCLEVNYRENGRYLGYRKAYITDKATFVEPPMDDVTHRLFELKLEKIGCAPANP